MSPREQLSSAVDNLIMDYFSDQTIDNNDPDQTKIIESYKKLNEKCDDVITKIKVRKSKKKAKK